MIVANLPRVPTLALERMTVPVTKDIQKMGNGDIFVLIVLMIILFNFILQ